MRRRKNSFLDILRSIGAGLGELLLGILRLFLKVILTFGLWLPGLYAVLGLVLYKGADFNPFDFSVYSVLYLSGGVACIVCAVIITLRNLIVKPVRRVIEKKRDKENDKWADEEFCAQEEAERLDREKKEAAFEPPDYEDLPELWEDEDESPDKEREAEKMPSYLVTDEDFNEEKSAEELLFDKKEWRPVKPAPVVEPKVVSAPKKEIPEVYFSKIDPSILVHEYSDRFELYRVVGEKTKFIGTENKA